MKLLYKNKSPYIIGGKYYFVSINTDNNKLYVTVTNMFGSRQNIDGTVTYNGVSKGFGFLFSTEVTLEFDYAENVKTVAVDIDGTLNTCTWHGNYSDPSPNVGITHTGVRGKSYFEAFFTYSGDVVNVRLISPLISMQSNGRWYYISTSPVITSQSFRQYIAPGAYTGTPYLITLLFACYASPDDEEDDYIGLKEYVLPIQYLSEEGTPYAPSGLSYDPKYAGVPFEISWVPVYDPEFDGITYSLTRTINGRIIQTVYTGNSARFTDVLPAGTDDVSYSIRSIAGEARSFEVEGDTVEVINSNVFVGIGGVPKASSIMYIGTNGDKKNASPMVFVGK